jgi:hypothetical protein
MPPLYSIVLSGGQRCLGPNKRFGFLPVGVGPEVRAGGLRSPSSGWPAGFARVIRAGSGGVEARLLSCAPSSEVTLTCGIGGVSERWSAGSGGANRAGKAGLEPGVLSGAVFSEVTLTSGIGGVSARWSAGFGGATGGLGTTPCWVLPRARS